MSASVPYTRSLRRRLLAYLVDNIAASVIATMVFVVVTLAAGDRVRISAGLINFIQCEGTTLVFDPDGRPVSTTGLDKVLVCTNTANFVVQDRRITISRHQAGEGWSTSEELTFAVDDQNRAIQPVYLDFLPWLVLIFGAAALEASRLRATPGKLLLGLSVASAKTQAPEFKATLIRNCLKNFWVFYLLLQYYLMPSILDYDNIFQNGKLTIPAGLWDQLMFSALMGAAIFIAMIVIIIGLFVPWKTAGRALYDKVAGTFVVRGG